MTPENKIGSGYLRWAAHSLVFTAVPVFLYVESLLEPLPDSIRTTLYVAALLTTFPTYFLYLIISSYKPFLGLAMILLGTFFRLTAMGVISLWLLVKHTEHLKSGALLFVAAIGSFLFFEALAVLGAYGIAYPGKGSRTNAADGREWDKAGDK